MTQSQYLGTFHSQGVGKVILNYFEIKKEKLVVKFIWKPKSSLNLAKILNLFLELVLIEHKNAYLVWYNVEYAIWYVSDGVFEF